MLTVVISGGWLSESLQVSLAGLVPFRTILLGCLMAIILDQQAGYDMMKKYFGHRLTILFIASVFFVFLLFFEGHILGVWQLFVHLLIFMFISCVVLNEKNIFHSLFDTLIVKQIGIVSYGIYIFHGQLWGITEKLLELVPLASLSQSRVLFFIIFTIISTIIALFSYYFFEAKLLMLKKKFAPAKYSVSKSVIKARL
jgi:peptidoglycan/LPS O-acetylase OafA/YrhL